MSLVVDVELDVGGMRIVCDLTVERGETVALVGPNGAGKSTVLRTIAGLAAADAGTIALDDRVWDDASSGTFLPAGERSIGLVFQDYALFDHLTAVENVAFGLRARGVDRATAERQAADMLGRVGVDEVARRRPGSLSGGQAQRVALARALVVEPEVVLLDEPLAALDASTRSTVRRELPSWLDGVATRSGLPACRVVVTHDPVDADALADRMVVLEAGRVTQRGTVFDLAAAPQSNYVADLMGTNLLHGRLAGSTFVVRGGGELTIGHHDAEDGEAVAAVRPAAIALHRARPEGSPRNVWTTTVAGIDRSHDRVRVRLAEPLPLVVEVTEGGLSALGADVGDPVWASVKASEVSVVGDG